MALALGQWAPHGPDIKHRELGSPIVGGVRGLDRAHGGPLNSCLGLVGVRLHFAPCTRREGTDTPVSTVAKHDLGLALSRRGFATPRVRGSARRGGRPPSSGAPALHIGGITRITCIPCMKIRCRRSIDLKGLLCARHDFPDSCAPP
jgi:hypothetical protein